MVSRRAACKGDFRRKKFALCNVYRTTVDNVLDLETQWFSIGKAGEICAICGLYIPSTKLLVVLDA